MIAKTGGSRKTWWSAQAFRPTDPKWDLSKPRWLANASSWVTNKWKRHCSNNLIRIYKESIKWIFFIRRSSVTTGFPQCSQHKKSVIKTWYPRSFWMIKETLWTHDVVWLSIQPPPHITPPWIFIPQDKWQTEIVPNLLLHSKFVFNHVHF